jgi:hypothetical protein
MKVIEALNDSQFGAIGTRKFAVAASADLIYPGYPVVRELGAAVVTGMATNKPVVATDYVVGVAASKSTNTALVAGTVEVIPLIPGQIWLATPKAPTSFDTQAEYDALVGDRVLFDLTTGDYTILAADNATYGCVIEPLDISKYPGKVAFAFRNDVSDLHA